MGLLAGQPLSRSLELGWVLAQLRPCSQEFLHPGSQGLAAVEEGDRLCWYPAGVQVGNMCQSPGLRAWDFTGAGEELGGMGT